MDKFAELLPAKTTDVLPICFEITTIDGTSNVPAYDFFVKAPMNTIL